VTTNLTAVQYNVYKRIPQQTLHVLSSATVQSIPNETLQIKQTLKRNHTVYSQLSGLVGGRGNKHHKKYTQSNVRLEIFMVMNIQVVIFWVVTPYSDMVR